MANGDVYVDHGGNIVGIEYDDELATHGSIDSGAFITAGTIRDFPVPIFKIGEQPITSPVNPHFMTEPEFQEMRYGKEQ